VPRQLFQSFWYQRELSPLEYLCIKSFLAHGHGFALYSYGEVENVPEGCVVEAAADILPEDSVFTYGSGFAAGSVSAFANLFRYKLLHDRGGFWVDADTLCLTSDIRDTRYVFAKQDDETYANGNLKAPKGSPLTATALARAQEYGSDVAFAANGPLLITKVISELGLEGEAWETNDLYPLHWRDAFAVLDPERNAEIEDLIRGSTFLHLWNQIFRLWSVLKTVRPPEGSFLADAYDKYDVPFPTGLRYEWSQLAPLVEVRKRHIWLWEEVERLREDLKASSREIERLRSPWERVVGPLVAGAKAAATRLRSS
jgi:hypothetical protein